MENRKELNYIATRVKGKVFEMAQNGEKCDCLYDLVYELTPSKYQNKKDIKKIEDLMLKKIKNKIIWIEEDGTMSLIKYRKKAILDLYK